MRGCLETLALAAALLVGPANMCCAQFLGGILSATTPLARAPVAVATTTLAPAGAIAAQSATGKPGALAVGVPMSQSTSMSAASLAVAALFVAAPPVAAPSKAAMHQRPTAASASTSAAAPATTAIPRQGGQAAAGGGDGIPLAAPTTPVIVTATHGVGGGVLEYGSCIAFESQCTALCIYGIHSMACTDGGICLCYGGDTGTDSTDEYSVATELSTYDTSAAHALLWRSSAWGACAAAVLAATSILA